MSLWNSVLTLINAAPPNYKVVMLEPDQVDKPDDPTPIAENTAYCCLWLAEMRLARGVAWSQHRYPLVYSATQYEYGGKQVTVPYVTSLDFFVDLKTEKLDRVLQGSRPITPLFPFSRGLVNLQAALFSMQSGNLPLDRFASTLKDFAGLLVAPVAPQLSAVSHLLDPLGKGIDELLKLAESQFQLGFQQTFGPAGAGGSGMLRAGYFAVILADEKAFDSKLLAVVNDRLRLRKQLSDPVDTSAPALEGYDYMLFRLQKNSAQHWEALTNITELVRKAETALLMKKPETAKEIMAAIRVEIKRSPDVVKADHDTMIAKIEAHLKSLRLHGASVQGRSLYAIMQQPAPDLDPTLEQSLRDLEEVLSDTSTGSH